MRAVTQTETQPDRCYGRQLCGTLDDKPMPAMSVEFYFEALHSAYLKEYDT